MWNGSIVAKMTTCKMKSVCAKPRQFYCHKNVASPHLSGMECVFQIWRLSVNMLYQPTCAGEKLCSRNLEFVHCLKILTIKKHLDTECYMELMICAGPYEQGNAPYLFL
jgi:hypothetical protein